MTTPQHGHRTERCWLSNPAAPVPTNSIFNRLTVLAIPLKSLPGPTNIMYAIGRRTDVTSLMSNGASLAERTSGLSRLGRRHMSSPARSRQLPLPRSSFSPDGRWIAFTSDESGQSEVYVQPFPGPGPKRQISSGGGQEPAWSHSGQELFYRTLGRMSTVAVRENDGELMAERPKPLFQGLFHYTPTFSRTYDVAPDGRFLMVAEPQPEHAPRQVNVVLNSVGASH